MNTLDFAQAVLTVYIVTLVIAESYILKSVRRLFREFISEVCPWRIGVHFVRYDITPNPLDTEPAPRDRVIYTDEKETTWEAEHEYAGYDFIGCRLCVGAWVTISFGLWWIPLAWILPVWGASWFLSRLER